MKSSIGLPPEQRFSRGQSRFALAIGSCALLLISGANVGLTQYLAHAFGYDVALGNPLLGRVYAPWAWHAWHVSFGEHYRTLFTVAFLVAFVLLLMLFFAGAFVISLVFRRSRAVSHLHGSAHWATPAEVQASGLLPLKGKPGAGVYIGGWTDRSGTLHYLRHNGPQHVLAFAPTRSGKGVGLIVPTLLSWEESAVIYDLKGENWSLTAGWRRQRGHRVLKFDPMDTQGVGARFNPLGEVRLEAAEEVSDVQNIVAMIIDPEGRGLADHWDKTSFMFLVGVVLFVLYQIRLRESRVASLPDVAAALSSSDGIERLYVEMRENAFGRGATSHEVIMRAAIDMLEKDGRERASVLSTAKSHFALYADPAVALNIAESDFAIADLMNHACPVSLYLVVDPQNVERLRPLLRLIITQIVRNLTPRLEFSEGTPVRRYRHRLLLMLDEFPALGRLPIFQEALAYIAGYGLKAYLITQDLSQLTAAYGREESITSNCHIKVAFAPNRLETAELLSRMTGTATVVKRVVGTSGKRFSLALGQVNETIQEFARPLLTPDECMRLPGARTDAETGRIVAPGDLLVFAAGQAPIYGRQILFFKDPVFSRRSQVATPERSDRIRQPVCT